MGRSHKNNKARLTNRERAVIAANKLCDRCGCKRFERARVIVQMACAAAVRAALARKARRA